ncbi:MAG TPA: hypothetical protein PLN52_22655 [Opitutaceae bacterium]|nr:hypothetical protein [Opitutaceae bacterium]
MSGSPRKKPEKIAGNVGRRELSKKAALSKGVFVATFAATAGDDAIISMTDPDPAKRAAADLFIETVQFARLARDLAEAYNRSPSDKSRSHLRESFYPAEHVVRFISRIVGEGKGEQFATALAKVYRNGLDKNDAFPELLQIPYAHASAFREKGRAPFVHEVQSILREGGQAIDVDTLGKHLRSLGLPTQKRGSKG